MSRAHPLLVILITLTLGCCTLAATPTTQAADTENISAKREFPAEWFWGTPEERARQDELVGRRMPLLLLSDAMNGTIGASAMEGKIVILHFWTTSCDPYLVSVPDHNRRFEKYKNNGVLTLGICSSRGQDRMAQIVLDKQIKFPVARDPTHSSAQAWRVMWWPTYAVVDREGKLRALGLKPAYIDNVIDKLLKEGPAPLRDVATTAPTTQFIDPVVSADWLEGESAERGELDALQGKAPPPLPNGLWLNSKPLKFPELKGKVILLDFWATWCPPCFEAIPHLNEMMDKYGREGFVIIGVCHPTGVQKMAAVVKEKGIRFPVVADPGEKFIDACKVDGFPDYFFIDRAGKLRIADCKNTQIENAIKALLSEPQPAATSPTRSPSTRRTR